MSLRILAVVLMFSALVGCDGMKDKEATALDKQTFFVTMQLPGLEDLVVTHEAKEWSGRDNLIRAYGSFELAQKEKITALLTGNGFALLEDRSFVGGDDNWQKIETRILEEKFFRKKVPGSETQFKILVTSDGQGIFQFELVDF